MREFISYGYMRYLAPLRSLLRRATTGYATAALPRSVRNSRRIIR
jgi:hypothetical protein